MYPLDEADGRRDAGTKAARLAAARRAGLRVPDGFVVPAGDEVDGAELGQALARLGGERFAVRSSADMEDRPGASAAGVFVSVVPVARDQVAAAIERVRAAASGAPARAYLGTRGIDRVRMAVLVQPYVACRRLGVLHTAPILDGAMWVEERAPSEPEWGEVTPRAVPVAEALARAARRLATLIGGEVDVEYALTDEGEVFLQARPLSAAPLGHDPLLWVAALASSLDGAGASPATWVRDAEHNPEPLSTAQAGLVARLEGRPGVPRHRVLHGFLYVEAADGVAPDRQAPPDAAALGALWQRQVAPRSHERLAALEDGPAESLSLEDALETFLAVATASMAELSPALRAARRGLDAFLRCHLGAGLEAHGGLVAGTGGRTLERDSALWALGRALAGPGGPDAPSLPGLLARFADRFGAYAPVWDVAVAPDDEEPERVLAMARLVARGGSPHAHHEAALEAAAMARRGVADRLAPERLTEFARLVEGARAAQQIGDEDDALFFRAQRLVRRALVARGRALAARGLLDDPALVFWATLEEVLAGVVDGAAAAARRERTAGARRLSAPSRIEGNEPRWRTLAARGRTQEAGARHGAGVLVGAGTSGRAWGRVFRLVDPRHPPAALPVGAVLVAEAILPSLTYLIAGATALVTDHGGALCHAATLAREYGVPAVLGTGGAMAALTDGEEVLVDGDAGKVFRLGRWGATS